MARLVFSVLAGVGLIATAASASGDRQVTPPNQGPPAATGVVIGRVVDGVTGEPVADAVVSTTGSASAPVRTDGSGRFLFEDLRGGSWALSAAKRGYLGGLLGQTHPLGTGQTLDLFDDARVLDVVLRLWKGAAIGGTILDEMGDPVVGIAGCAYPWLWIAGRRVLETSAPTCATTDDRGKYRIPKLVPGSYIVSVPLSDLPVPAVPGPEGSRMYPAMFYSTVATPSAAETVSVAAGEDRSAVNFQLRLAPTAPVSGMVSGPAGPAGNVDLRLVPAGLDAMMTTDLAVATTRSDDGGAFTFPAVPPGRYDVRAVKPPGGSEADPPLWGTASVTVERAGLRDVAILLGAGIRVTGVVDWRAMATPPSADDLGRLSIRIERADARIEELSEAEMRPTREGRFRSPELAPGPYLIRVESAPAMWRASQGDRDVSIQPIEIGAAVTEVTITLTDGAQRIGGLVRRPDSSPNPDAAVLVFSTDRTTWVDYGWTSRHLQRVRTARDGSYLVSDLPSGEYLVVAVPDDPPAGWRDPAYLERLVPTALTVTVGRGESVRQDLYTSFVR